MGLLSDDRRDGQYEGEGKYGFHQHPNLAKAMPPESWGFLGCSTDCKPHLQALPAAKA